MAADIRVPSECRDMIRAGALVAINTSGGKDSRAITILLSRFVPRDQEPAVLSYQRAVHRHQFAQQPQLLDVTLAELLAGAPFLLEQAAGPVHRLVDRRHRLAGQVDAAE